MQSWHSDRRDKPKHSGKTGAVSGAKKGGGGGKGTWGRPGDEAKNADLDPNDPNFDPDEAAAAAGPSESQSWDFEPDSSAQIKFANSLDDLAKFKASMKAATKEFLQSNDVAEFQRILTSIGMSVFHQDLPYVLIKFSFDLSDNERVRVSNLLGALSKHGLITSAQFGAGVRKLYERLDDLIVDAPNAKVLLREHIQFAVAGGFLDAGLAKKLEEEHDALADTAKVAATKSKIDSIVTEFFASEDLPDAVTALKELNAPHMHFAVVQRLISKSLDAGNRQREGASVFLADQAGSLLTHEAIEKGFTALLERVEDLALDVPDALKLLSIFIARAVVDEALAPAFLVRVDLGEHDAGSQVLRQAQALLKQENASDALLYVW